MCNYLGIQVNTDDSKRFNSDLKGEDRIIDLCKKVGANKYINLPGGLNLYNRKRFESEGINLEFMPMTKKGTLSILDNCFNENNICFKTWP